MAEVKITHEGQSCRKCGTPVIKKSHDAPTRSKQEYWFKYWFYCPTCKTRYMVESAKVYTTKKEGEIDSREGALLAIHKIRRLGNLVAALVDFDC